MTEHEVLSIATGPFPLLTPDREALYVSVGVRTRRGRLSQIHTVALEVRLADGRARAFVVADDPSAAPSEFIVPPDALNLFLEATDFSAYPPVRHARLHPELCRTAHEAYGVDFGAGCKAR
jgi:hypothetical protein